MFGIVGVKLTAEACVKLIKSLVFIPVWFGEVAIWFSFADYASVFGFLVYFEASRPCHILDNLSGWFFLLLTLTQGMFHSCQLSRLSGSNFKCLLLGCCW